MRNCIFIFILNYLILQTTKTEPTTTLEPTTTHPRSTPTAILSPRQTFKILISSIEIGENYTLKSEIIDLSDSKKICEDFPDRNPYFEYIYNWISGIVNETLIYCGCFHWNEINFWHCGTTKETNVSDTRIHCEKSSRAVFLDDESLLLSESNEAKIIKFSYVDDGQVKMTEELSQVTKLPAKLVYHCITRVDEAFAIIVGNHEESDENDGPIALLINMENNSYIQIGNLNEPRLDFICASFEHEGKNVVIVVGGHKPGLGSIVYSSEILISTNINENWFKGMSISKVVR